MLRLAIPILTLTIGVLFAPLALAQAVSGMVTDAEKTVPFKGAIVRIEGMQRTTTTDSRGRFRLANVPPGDHTLIVSYIGTDDSSFPITVTSDGLDMGDVVIGADASYVSQIEEVLIFGQSAAIAGALNQ